MLREILLRLPPLPSSLPGGLPRLQALAPPPLRPRLPPPLPRLPPPEPPAPRRLRQRLRLAELHPHAGPARPHPLLAPHPAAAPRRDLGLPRLPPRPRPGPRPGPHGAHRVGPRHRRPPPRGRPAGVRQRGQRAGRPQRRAALRRRRPRRVADPVLQDRKSLAEINTPVDAHITMQSSFQILRMEGSGLGLAVLTDVSMELWERKADPNNVAGWMLLKTIKLDELLSLTMPTIKPRTAILGYDEDGNTMFASFDSEIFKIQLDSMQFKSLFKSDFFSTCYPFTSVYTIDSQRQELLASSR
ncbi:hypothetical protein ACP4OV_010224 [Aristida adscensionis]